MAKKGGFTPILAMELGGELGAARALTPPRRWLSGQRTIDTA